MKTLTFASLLLVLSVPRLTPPAPGSVHDATRTASAHRGTWYMASSGHAVFCYGPVMTMHTTAGTLQKVATVCRGDQTLVPLRD
jgi:hypothetical protein